jgi:catechol 2,3-dioxygenase-like lactoylglutathione lyase family enzyme
MPPHVHVHVHVHLHVADLARSRDFYERFLGSAPVKLEADYAKFLPEFAPLNLALTRRRDGASHPPLAGHFGLQLESSDEVRAQLARVRAAGLAVREEFGVDCCYATQDKFWVRDPDGVEWEVYVLTRDLPRRGSLLPTVSGSADACCAPESPCSDRTR